MKKTIQIPEGNEFSLFIPFVVFSKSGREDASAALWNDLQVVVRMSNSTANVDCTYSVQAQYVVVSFGNDLKRSSYDVIISGEYETRKVCAPLNNHFAITAWADGNYADFIVGQPIICPTQTIIGQFNTTQDIEDLTEELRAALAATEAAKEEYEEKVEELSDVAQQSTLTEGIADIRGDIAGISIDTSTIAKQGTNASATLTATQTAATNAYASAEAAKTATIDGNDTAIGVAKEIRSEVGTGSDTAAETGTLFAVVKWVKDKVKSIFNLIGSPATGQPATLFAAIAAGGGGGSADALEQEVETGKGLIAQAIEDKGGTATSTMSLSQLAGAIDNMAYPTLLKLQAVTFVNDSTNEIIDMGAVGAFTGNLSFKNYASAKKIINIPPLAPTSMSEMFSGCGSLEEISFSSLNLSACTTLANAIYQCYSIKDFSFLSAFAGENSITNMSYLFSGATINVTTMDAHWLDTSHVTTMVSSFSTAGKPPMLEILNIKGWSGASLTGSGINSVFYGQTKLTSWVGGDTYDSVVTNNTKVFEGLNVTNPSFNYPSLLDQASLRALINGLYDRTGLSTFNLALGNTLKAKLSADDIAVATAKNWTIS